MVDDLVAADPLDLSDAAFADELLGLRREIDRLEGVFSRAALTGHRRGVGQLDGATSTAAWLRVHAGMRAGEAKGAIELGELSELLADTGEAWRAGDISTGAVRTIAGARVAGHDEKLRAVEPELLGAARAGSMPLLRRLCGHFRNRALADGSDPGEHDGIHLSHGYQGRMILHGELGDVAGETVATAIHAFTDAPTSEDSRTPAKRRADALVRLCEVALDHAPDGKRARAHVSVVVDWATLAQGKFGRCEGEFNGPIHPHDVERLLCDSTISRVVTDPAGLPLDVGRASYTPPPSMRRAVVARDGGCRFPDCGRPAGWTSTHHVHHWMRGGHTSVGNLVLLCDFHHRLVHTPGWHLTFDGTTLTVTRPNGTVVRDGPRPRGGASP